VAIIGPSRPSRLCNACGTTIDAEAEICPYCGVRQNALQKPSRARGVITHEVSERKLMPAVLLCVFFGVFGAHRFYTGKMGTAVLQLCTLGGLGIWATIDLIILIVGSFKDKEGRVLTEWT
jgi:TM2 domain-containing membrane protein YozV